MLRKSNLKKCTVSCVLLMVSFLLVSCSGGGGSSSGINNATIYISAPSQNRVYPLLPATETIGAPMTIGGDPQQLTNTYNGLSIFIATPGTNDISEISPLKTDPVDFPIHIGLPVTNLVIESSNGHVNGYAVYNGKGIVSVDILTRKVLGVYNYGSKINTVQVSPSGLILYATDKSTNEFYKIDVIKHKIKRVIQLPGVPTDLQLSPNGVIAYISISNLNEVIPINLENYKVEAPIPTGINPSQILIDKTTLKGYVINAGSNYISQFSLINNESLNPILTLPDLTAGVVSVGGLNLYVTSSTLKELAQINTISESQVASVPLNFNPGYLTING